MRNKALWIILALILVAGVGSLGGFTKPKSLSTSYRVGFVLPITGDAAIYGESAKKAADLAIKDVKKEFGVSLLSMYEDSQLDTAKAVSAGIKLLSIDYVQALVTFSSGETLAICPITVEKKSILFTSGSSPAISNCGGNTFRNYPSDIYQGKVLAEKALNAGYKKISLIYINNDYGNGLKNEFTKNYTGMLQIEAHSVGQRDFRTSIAKIKDQRPDAVILISQLAEASQFFTQLDTLGVRIPVIGSEALKENELISKIPPTITPYLSVVSVSPYKGNQAQVFKNEYKQAYGEDPGAFADYVYDNVMILGAAVKDCSSNLASDSNCISNYLRKVQAIGATGNISFDERGDVQKKEYDLFVVEGKSFKIKD